MTAEELVAVCAYCRIPHPPDAEDAIVLEMLYPYGVSYLTAAGVPMPEKGTERRAQYDVLLYAIVLDGYDQRSAGTQYAFRENPAWRRSLNQLKQVSSLERMVAQ